MEAAQQWAECTCGSLLCSTPTRTQTLCTPPERRRGYAEETYIVVTPRHPSCAIAASRSGLLPGRAGLAAPAGVPLPAPEAAAVELQGQPRQEEEGAAGKARTQPGKVPANVVVPEEAVQAAWQPAAATPPAKPAATAAGMQHAAHEPTTPALV